MLAIVIYKSKSLLSCIESVTGEKSTKRTAADAEMITIRDDTITKSILDSR